MSLNSHKVYLFKLFKLRDTWKSSDCRIVYSCEERDGSPQIIRKRARGCARNAECVVKDGAYTCSCMYGFRGDGAKRCRPMSK